MFYSAIKTLKIWENYDSQYYKNLSSSNEGLNKVIAKVGADVYDILKEGNCLPKLRKENLYLENTYNTFLQTRNFDYIYDTQDLFDHYEDYFEMREFNNLIVKTEDLPLEEVLKNYPILEQGFINSEEDMENLKRKRHYVDIFEDKVKTEERSPSDNPIIYILDSLQNTFKSFCQMTLKLILQYEDEKITFVHEYVSRFNSFIETAFMIDELLENLVVIVNKLYEASYPDEDELTPRFSIFRMMSITWNKYVLDSVKDKLIKIGEELFKEIIEESLRPEEFKCNSSKKEETSLNQSVFCIFSDENDSTTDFSTGVSSINNHQNSQNCGFFQEMRNYESSKERALNSLTFSMLDNSCNEFSVMLLNSVNMVYEPIYQEYEAKLLSQLESQVNEQKYALLTSRLFNKLSNNSCIKSGFANTTKHRMNSKIFQLVNEIALERIYNSFELFAQENLNKNFSYSKKDIDNDEQWFNTISDYLLTNAQKNYNYSINVFLREQILKGKNDDANTLKDCFAWKYENDEIQNLLNKEVETGVKRKVPFKSIFELAELYSLNRKSDIINKVEGQENTFKNEDIGDNDEDDGNGHDGGDNCNKYPKDIINIDAKFCLCKVASGL